MSTVELSCPICEYGFETHDLYAAHLATAHLPGAPAGAPGPATGAPTPAPSEAPDSAPRPYLAAIGNFAEYDELEAVRNEAFFRELDGEPPLEGVRGLVVPDLSTTMVGPKATATGSAGSSLLDAPAPARIDPNRIYDPERHESASLQVIATVLVVALLCGVIFLLQSA